MFPIAIIVLVNVVKVDVVRLGITATIVVHVGRLEELCDVATDDRDTTTNSFNITSTSVAIPTASKEEVELLRMLRGHNLPQDAALSSTPSNASKLASAA